MAQQTINISTANDGLGDPLRDAFDKANQNFTELYAGLVGLLDFKGSTDCSGNPNYPAASKGDAYLVSVAGKIGGASGTSVDAGDMFIASADNAGGTQAAVGSSWFVVEHNLVGALLTSGGTMSGALNFAPSVDVASATTTDIGAAASNIVRITGTVTISGLGTIAAGAARWVRFAGALTLTYNATSLILPGAADIVTVAGDTALFVSEGSGNWRCWAYQRAAAAPFTPTNVQVFTANGTWTKPVGAKAVEVLAFGAGGGGGGGAKAAAATAQSGGGGGGGGVMSRGVFDAGDLTSTVAVTVGTAGTAGTGASSNGNGGNGGVGGDTSFGSYLFAWGGGGGAGGQVGTGSGGGGGGGLYTGGSSSTSGTGGGAGQGGGAGGSGAAPTAATTGGGGGGGSSSTGALGAGGGAGPFGAGGGGSGGGISVADATSSGGGGGRSAGNTTIISGGTAGNPGSTASALVSSLPGGGGGGGGSSTAAVGGAGGAGQAPAGGGGGGGGSQAGNGGAGGAGAVGRVVVVTRF